MAESAEPRIPKYDPNDPTLQRLENRPAVFMFQPTHFKMVSTPEELRAWEYMMEHYVGLKSTAARFANNPWKGSPGGSISGSGGTNGGWDD